MHIMALCSPLAAGSATCKHASTRPFVTPCSSSPSVSSRCAASANTSTSGRDAQPSSSTQHAAAVWGVCGQRSLLRHHSLLKKGASKRTAIILASGAAGSLGSTSGGRGKQVGPSCKGVGLKNSSGAHKLLMMSRTHCKFADMTDPPHGLQVTSLTAKLLVGTAVAYIALMVLVPFANVFYQVSRQQFAMVCVCV